MLEWVVLFLNKWLAVPWCAILLLIYLLYLAMATSYTSFIYGLWLMIVITTDVYIYSSGYRTGHGC